MSNNPRLRVHRRFIKILMEMYPECETVEKAVAKHLMITLTDEVQETRRDEDEAHK